MVEAGDKGAAVRLQGGGYYFTPNYAPEQGDKTAAVPLKSGGAYAVGMAGNEGIQADDKPVTIPSESGTQWAAKQAPRESGLPLQISAGVADYSASIGTKRTLGTFSFYWNGDGSIYISGSSSGAASLTIKDGVYSGASYGTQNDPAVTSAVNITSWGIVEGDNSITIQIGTVFNGVIGCSALYLIQV